MGGSVLAQKSPQSLTQPEDQVLEEIRIQSRRFFNSELNWNDQQISGRADDIVELIGETRERFEARRKVASEQIGDIWDSFETEEQILFFRERLKILRSKLEARILYLNEAEVSKSEVWNNVTIFGVTGIGLTGGALWGIKLIRGNEPKKFTKAIIATGVGAGCGALLGWLGSRFLPQPDLLAVSEAQLIEMRVLGFDDDD